MRFWWLGVFVLALAVYLYALDGLYIPHIGDEAPYIEIARLTGASGAWLPLKTAPGLENTKPPLLYWVGIVSTQWGRHFTLFRLRLPIVLCTFVLAALVGFVTERLTKDRVRGALGGLTFLGFYSSFQYGRPFLTNQLESLFVFLSFAILLLGRRYRDRFALWVGIGVSLGIACLFKSFALVAPVGLALAWFTFMERGDFLVRDALRIAVAVIVALGCFAIWPLLDPEPGAILQHFVLEENLGKFGGEGYLRGLFAGPYPIYRLWLGHLGNAGFFALPLIYLVVRSVRERQSATVDEKGLWILVLSFLIVYSVPSQRQENYLIPAVPALSILLAMRWPSTGDDGRWFRLFHLPGIAMLVVLIPLMWAARSDILPAGSYAAWQLAVPVATLVGWLFATLSVRRAPHLFHGLVFLSFLSLATATAPFEGPAGRFELDRVARLAGRRVYVPEDFIRKHERHRFLLPGMRVEGYDPSDSERLTRLLESGRMVVVRRAFGETATGPFRVFARRLDLTSRHSLSEMWRIAFGRELHLLVRQELVVRRFRRGRT